MHSDHGHEVPSTVRTASPDTSPAAVPARFRQIALCWTPSVLSPDHASSDHADMTPDQRRALDEITSGEVRDLARCAVHLYRTVPPAAVVAAVLEWTAGRRLRPITWPLRYVESARPDLDAIVARHAARERMAERA